MQFQKANELRKIWGNEPCNHPDFDKEYYLSTNTGDYVCTQCGRSFSKETKDQIEENNSKSTSKIDVNK